MDMYQKNIQEEKKYLKDTLGFICKELDKEIQTLSNRKGELLESRREMWDNTVHFSNDFDRLMEISQYLSVLNTQTISYDSVYKQIQKYEKMIKSPYFGRFDFVEEGSMEKEKIYVGIHNVIDSESFNIFVYDWRSPIASIFYQHELGKVSYKAPTKVVKGNVLLKRQYKIQNGKLKDFFDCSIKINDEILGQILCGNAASKMKNIVETIQKEQDIIIRDTNNEVLIVQGVAGSGKTSIALHRIAFLLYNGMQSKLTSNNILIISPNAVFSKYISYVLPELGEENVAEITFDDLATKLIKGRLETEKKIHQLEAVILNKNSQEMKIRRSSIEFKESNVFVQILNRWIHYYERHMIEFEDVYYHGRMIETKQILKNQFLHDKIGRPIAKRLKRIEIILLDKIHPLQKERIKKIEKLVQRMDEHQLEIKSFSRLLSIKESGRLLKKIRKFSQIDYLKVYSALFSDKDLFLKLSKGLMLPDDIEEIIEMSRRNLDKGYIYYEDCAPLMFLKLKIEGNDLFYQIKQVVIDEAQDYSVVQYEVFNLLFKEARFTVLGDIHQSIDKNVNESLYDHIAEILNRKKSVKLFLDKSYRSSYEISLFSKKILNLEQDIVSFQRYETKPIVLAKNSHEGIENDIISKIKKFIKEDYQSIGIICKTAKESKKVYNRLKNLVNIKIIDSENEEVQRGVIIIPAYMAKGLEFDVVLVYNASSENYSNELDRKLLYIACTRALHQLVLYYTGKITPFID
ncbi:MAG: AAA family ATPase [Marinisporobacter sp.]|jgi:DNA helicase-2/ATP-dependent DNA helicase PcrA|nr:AAA family ATPase [Marinisporobacter sp.]